MVAPTSDKDERKKRISDKGLNRMSQIRAGRPHHASSSSSHSSDFTHGDGARDRNLLFSDDDDQAPAAPQTYQSHNNAGSVGLSESSSCTDLKQAGMNEISSANSQDAGGQTDLLNTGTDKQSSHAQVVAENEKPQTEMSSIRKASANLESVQKTSRTQSNVFSSRLLNSCIIASEKTRGLCALVIAICVLLSHINLPLLGYSIGKSDSNVASKPLYMILLMDIAVLGAQLFLDKKGVVVGSKESKESEEEKTGASQDNKENWDVTVMLLERGLVAYRTIRALLTDFSIYAVVVICGTCLL